MEKHWDFADEDRETVVTKTLTSILDASLPDGSSVDLLSIDVEGHDLQVLKGLDSQNTGPRL
ncbi:MAG: FkbM family methyltransferase [Acidobacteria bacterium]|nr:FkbM family methyltransferase [Acidobacteriota bacterium]